MHRFTILFITILSSLYFTKAQWFGGAGENDSTDVFDQTFFIESPTSTILMANITGLPPGKYGLHIHEFGDVSNNCENTGPHYNPHNKTHGAVTDKERHSGDFGNIEVKEGDKYTIYRVENDLIRLKDIIGRPIVLHAGADDLGRGGNELSKVNGNSGKKIACSIIKDISK